MSATGPIREADLKDSEGGGPYLSFLALVSIVMPGSMTSVGLDTEPHVTQGSFDMGWREKTA